MLDGALPVAPDSSPVSFMAAPSVLRYSTKQSAPPADNQPMDNIQALPAMRFAVEVQAAVQGQALDAARTQGEDLVRLIDSASVAPSGSANLPHQGQHVDVSV